jgi:polar amino acid transport system ATP-binding protein
VHRIPREAAEEQALRMLDRVGLRDRARAHPDELSGGQQQRVAIARALVNDPVLMLFDEVTSALDPELVGEVLAMLRDLKSDGMTMIVATHEMGFARNVADDVCFLHGGRVLERGSPDQVLDAPRHDRTRRFLRRVLDAGRL